MATWAATFEEQSVLAGRLWYIDKTFVLPATSSVSIALASGDTAPAIVALNIDTNILVGDMEVFEDEAFTGGTSVIIHRVNRNAAQTVKTIITENVTFTPTTSPIREVPIIGTRNEINGFTGNIGLILKKNANTILRITNNDPQTKTIFLNLVFGESDLF